MVSLVLNAAQKRKIDGFQNRCLRKIIGVKPSYISRVSNVTVLARASYTSATNLLLKRRLQFLGKILRCPEGHPLRIASFIPHTLLPLTDRYVRRVGRPSKEWMKEALNEAASLFGSLDRAAPHAMRKATWDAELLQKLGF